MRIAASGISYDVLEILSAAELNYLVKSAFPVFNYPEQQLRVPSSSSRTDPEQKQLVLGKIRCGGTCTGWLSRASLAALVCL